MLTRISEARRTRSPIPPEPTIEVPVQSLAALLTAARHGVVAMERADRSDSLLYEGHLLHVEALMEENARV